MGPKPTRAPGEAAWTLYVVLIVLAMTIVFMALQAWPEENTPPDPALLQALADNTFPIATVQPNDDFQDLQFLKPILADKRIVALGEATHGTREFFLMKHRLLRFLVREMGFRLFAIEAGVASSRAINDYVLHGTGSGRQALMGLEYWTWKTEEVLNLIEWMRTYNADPATTHKVQFLGIDPVFGERDRTMAANVRAILEQEGEESKVVVWAHNGHIAMTEGRMGRYLKEEFGDRVYLIGFEFNRGTFVSRRDPLTGTLTLYRVGPASSHYYAYTLARLNAPILFLDFRRLCRDELLCRWLREPHLSHNMDELYYVSRFKESWHTLDVSWLELYDGLVFVENTTGSQNLLLK